MALAKKFAKLTPYDVLHGARRCVVHLTGTLMRKWTPYDFVSAVNCSCVDRCNSDPYLFSGEHRWAAISAFGHLEEVGGSARSLPAGAGGGPGPLC